MSRMGSKPITVPDNVKVTIQNMTITIEGPNGKLSYTHRPEVKVNHDSSTKTIAVTREDDSRQASAYQGLARALLANMVEGVTKGYSKTLEIYGTGYGVKEEGKALALTVGYANVVKLPVPLGVKVEIKAPQSRSDTNPAVFSISGPDKQVVGEYAAKLRAVKKPEPYKGKGVRYQGEHVRRKAGKVFGAAK